MRVLHVIDRIVGALADREVAVEFNGRVVRACEQEVACGVNADLLDQLVERHVFTLAL